MLEKLRTSLLLPAELVDATNRYRQVLIETQVLPGEIEDSNVNQPFIQTIFTLLDEAQQQMGKALTAVRANQLVSQLAEADAIRDDLFIGFRDTIDAGKRRRQADLQEAWQLIWPVIKSAGTRLHTLGYAAQSGRLEALFDELDQEAYQSAIDTLRASEIYEELKEAQTEFITIYDQRLKLDLENQFPTLRDAKAPLVKHLNNLLAAMDVLGETNPETYETIIQKLNSITNEIMVVAKARRTRKSEEIAESLNDNALAAS